MKQKGSKKEHGIVYKAKIVTKKYYMKMMQNKGQW